MIQEFRKPAFKDFLVREHYDPSTGEILRVIKRDFDYLEMKQKWGLGSIHFRDELLQDSSNKFDLDDVANSPEFKEEFTLENMQPETKDKLDLMFEHQNSYCMGSVERKEAVQKAAEKYFSKWQI